MPMMRVCDFYAVRRCYMQIYVNDCDSTAADWWVPNRCVCVHLAMVTRVIESAVRRLARSKDCRLTMFFALSLRLCINAFGYAIRLIRSFGRRETRGNYRCMTMSRAKSLFVL